MRFCWNWRCGRFPCPCSRSSDSLTSRSRLTWSETASAWLFELRCALRDLVGPDLALDPPADVVGQHAERADRIGEVELAEPRELLAERLHPDQRDERAQHVVGALEDREDADVAQDLLVGLVAHVAVAALELQRAVGLVPEELGPRDLAHRRLERVVGDAGVDEAGGQVGHRLEPEQVGDHPADLLLDQLEVGQRAAELPRSLTCSIARSSSPLAAPTEPVPRPMRPLLRICIAIRKPSPGSPSTFSGGIRTSLK